MSNIFKGLAFPFQKRGKLLPAPAFDEELIKMSLVQIIMTVRGSRTMRPALGSNAMNYVFENNDAIRAEMFKSDLLNSIAQQEPRVAIRTVTLGTNNTTMLVNISYVIISIQEERRLTLGLPLAS